MNVDDGASPIRPPWVGTPRHHCFGCAPHNPAGLAMKMVEDGNRLTCEFSLTHLHESYPGMIHGGVAAALLDELMGNVLVHHERKVCFTTGLRVTYAGTLLIGRRYRALAWVLERPGGVEDIYRVVGEIQGADGQALVFGRATFQWMTEADWCRAFGDEGWQPDDSLRALLRPQP
jgi:acyl-coenzyme A thioesterase PaaI-like protein